MRYNRDYFYMKFHFTFLAFWFFPEDIFFYEKEGCFICLSHTFFPLGKM